jgi:DNA polymerase
LERPLWLLDLAINRRGIPVDLDLCRGAIKVYETEVENAYRRLEQVTNSEATKTTQVKRIKDWVNKRVNFGESLGAEEIETWLALNPEAPEEVREVLELRQLAGGTAVGKYKAALNFAQLDDRVRDQILYYGATTTGRWSGKGLQPHNFKREKTLDDTFIDAIKTGDHATVEALGELDGKTTFDVLKGCLRGIICAPKGKKLLFSDFAGIESRVLNWLCRNEVKLELFRKGQDAYIHTALDVYDTDYETIADWNGKKWKIKKDHGEKRQIGKACELGLGYGMGWKTFQVNAAKAGSMLDDAFSNEVVNKWRAANPEIPEFWYRIEKACKFVIWNKKKKADVNGLKVFWDPRGYLCIQLPSGRCLRYYNAQVHKDRAPNLKTDADGNPVELRDQIFYLDGGKFGHHANDHRISTYGGKLCENIVQAISRDLLVNSMLIIDAAGIPIIFHVHDEVVTEVDEDDNESFHVVHKAMETIPSWAAGLPLEAETQESRRFTK